VSSQTIVSSGIELSAEGIRIGDRPQLLLCASLFYFRLPREEWRARLEQVRASGYTCVDVYLPWNFHETAPGRWSFEGRRDVAKFLDLAHAAGLYVIARPGPYICSEWDGGGLPAWLGLDPQLRVRQNEPRFLAQVSGWFDKVFPVLAERQYSTGGPVIMVQIENELDFFDCADRTGYLTALRDQAIEHGITVPLVACAGQGDLAAATGDVAGVAPACNFYPDDDSPHIESEVRWYAQLLAERGLPLLVTETNRRHRTLRRLLASGASLIAPYLQSSGWNFGYTPSTGNWGAPGNLMSHGYDFGGYVSSTGVERAEFAEAQVMSRVLNTLGPRLARATPGVACVDVTADFPTTSSPAALDLDGGGQVLALPNLGTVPGVAVLSSPSVGRVPIAVAADASPLLLLDLPLQIWGVELTMALASADLVDVAAGDGVLALAFSSDVPVTVVLDGVQGARVDGSPTRGEVDDRVAVVIPPAVGTPERRTVAGTDRAGSATAVTLVVLPPSHAARLITLQTDGDVDIAAAPAPIADRCTTEILKVRRRPGAAPARPVGKAHELPPTLESLGVYRGRGAYAATADLTGINELLLVGASDLVDLSVAGLVRPTIAGFGATERIDVREVRGSAEIHATVEIWGHSNFDDARLPALRLGGLRGLGTLWTVQTAQDVSALWTVDGNDHWASAPAPTRTLGGWSSTRVGMPITYTRVLDIDPAAVSALCLHGLAAPVRVAVDGGEPVTVHRENPWVMLPAGAGRISLTMPHNPSSAGLRAELLTLQPVTGWSCTVQDDNLLTAFSSDVQPSGEQVGLPLGLKPGEEAWLDVDLPASDTGWLLRLDGTQVRATGWAGGECLGRLWLADASRPRFSGGDSDILWVPAAWTAAGARLTLLLRATDGPLESVLRMVRLQSPRSAC
jgi:beta-galactosidase